MFIEFREWKGERERERHQCEGETSISCLLYVSQPGRTHNLGMFPDQELNWDP